MFKSIITRDHGEPWPATGMTSQRWLSVPLRTVLIEDLIATQSGVYFHGLVDNIVPVGGDIYPHVILWQGEYYLEDGHHRVVRTRLKGYDRIVVRVLEIKPL